MSNVELFAPVHYGFGYDDSTDTFKVVAVFWDRTTQKMDGRIHCMGGSCWRKTLACPTIPTLLGIMVGAFVNAENGDLLLMANKERVDIIKYNSKDVRVEYIQLPNNQIWYADEHMQSLVLPRPHPH
ncbi:hypothetical protein P8452_64568 [Trifolium repens]|nr:hypothetical protein P8452_64568 [Trifolium repens]